MTKCLLPCSSFNSCLQSNPRKILFLFSTLDILITQTCRKALWFTSRQFILGTDNSLMLWHCLQLSSEGYNLEWLHQAHVGKHKPLVVGERQEGLPESIILLQPGTQEYTRSSPFLKKRSVNLPTSTCPQPANQCSMSTVWGTALQLSAIPWHCCDQDTLTTPTQPPKHVFILQ